VDQLADTVSVSHTAQSPTTVSVSAAEQMQLDNKIGDLSSHVNTLLSNNLSSSLMRMDDQFTVVTSKLHDQLNLFTDARTQAAETIRRSHLLSRRTCTRTNYRVLIAPAYKSIYLYTTLFA